MRFGVAVIGATGYIGAAYRAEIREAKEATLVALCARRRDRLEAAAREDGAALATDDWRQVDAALSAAGSLADVGSHACDTLRWILGQEAVRVWAHAEVLSPAKPDLGAINLDEALRWGEGHAAADSPRARRGTAPDFAQVAFVLENGAVGSLVLSHATYLRKGLAPELELHGTEASLAVDRLSGGLTLVRPGKAPELLATVPGPGFGNRFSKHVFPALRQRAAGEPTEHPGLDDGWRVQRFTDAAALSAQSGAWVALADLATQGA